MKPWKILHLLVLLYLTFGLPTARVDPKVLSEMRANETTTAILRFHDNFDQIHKLFQKLAFPTRNERLNVMYTLLKTNADTHQARAISSLEKRKQGDPDCTYQQIWVANAIVVHNMDEKFMTELTEDCPEIQTVEANNVVQIHPLEINPASEVGSAPMQSQQLENWGFDKVQTAAAHGLGCTGDYVVVSNIDSGVLWNHEALKSQYRGGEDDHNYNWFDAAEAKQAPTDTNGHGTHTMGTICGTKHNIGHAPRAKWVACRAGVDTTFTEARLLACAQWIICPTDTKGNNPDCTKAPHVVNNSWAGPDIRFFNPVIAAWNSVGIVSFFAIGNQGILNVCKTGESPGDQKVAFSVGATDEDDALAEFSGTGPGEQNVTKPDVCAPGVNILSASVRSTTAYLVENGTSFATPCVTAMAALVLGIRPDLSPEQVYRIIEEGSEPHAPSVLCTPSDTTELNNQYGHGRVNARKICMISRNNKPGNSSGSNPGYGNYRLEIEEYRDGHAYNKY